LANPVSAIPAASGDTAEVERLEVILAVLLEKNQQMRTMLQQSMNHEPLV
jgi:hypothetical protein